MKQKIIEDIVSKVIEDRHYTSDRIFKSRMDKISKDDLVIFFKNNRKTTIQILDLEQSKSAMLEDIAIYLTA